LVTDFIFDLLWRPHEESEAYGAFSNGLYCHSTPVKSADLDQLLDLLNDLESVSEFLPNLFVSEAAFRSEYERTGFLSEGSSRFVIADSDERIVGMAWSFKSIPYFDALEVGYRIFDTKDRNNGFATEALNLLCKYIFESNRTNRIEIRVAAQNVASQKVAVNAGFVHEGIHRQAAFSKGTVFDMSTYALLRDEWATIKGA